VDLLKLSFPANVNMLKHFGAASIEEFSLETPFFVNHHLTARLVAHRYGWQLLSDSVLMPLFVSRLGGVLPIQTLDVRVL